ncbi:cecropin-A-like [Arctopsyche grandis]|uniref:cecropin-A-like n=1 Tax=Arctopsyche grandis TaxID=121162 RepID=UPI00406D7CA0
MRFPLRFFVFFLISIILASQVSSSPVPEPRWKGWKKIEKVGRNVRDGLIKAAPAVAVVQGVAALG